MTAPSIVTRTLPYGDLPDQLGDLLLPSQDDSVPLPVVMLIHGGFWRDQYRRDTLEPLARDLAGRGRAVWNIEYRRVGAGGGQPETPQDVVAAFDAIAQLADGLDAERITVVGHSAGGHLALWLAAQRPLAAVVSLAGVADLAAAESDHLGDDAVREFLRGGGAADHVDLDPARLVPTGVPTLLVHGDADVNVPIDQSERYLVAATDAGDRCELLRLPGADHFTIIDPGSDAWRQTLERWPA
jgi:acetyl esterase/lipase